MPGQVNPNPAFLKNRSDFLACRLRKDPLMEMLEHIDTLIGFVTATWFPFSRRVPNHHFLCAHHTSCDLSQLPCQIVGLPSRRSFRSIGRRSYHPLLRTVQTWCEARPENGGRHHLDPRRLYELHSAVCVNHITLICDRLIKLVDAPVTV